MADKKMPKVKIDVEKTSGVLAEEENAVKEVVEQLADDASDTAVLPRESQAEQPAPAEEPQSEHVAVIVEAEGEPDVEAEPAAEGEPVRAGAASAPVPPTGEPIPIMTSADTPAEESAQPAKPAPIVSFAWLSKHFPGHEHAAVGCLFGLLAAIGVLTVGVWNTVFVVAMMALGTEAGNCLDGSNGLLSHLRRGSDKK